MAHQKEKKPGNSESGSLKCATGVNIDYNIHKSVFLKWELK